MTTDCDQGLAASHADVGDFLVCGARRRRALDSGMPVSWGGPVGTQICDWCGADTGRDGSARPGDAVRLAVEAGVRPGAVLAAASGAAGAPGLVTRQVGDDVVLDWVRAHVGVGSDNWLCRTCWIDVDRGARRTNWMSDRIDARALESGTCVVCRAPVDAGADIELVTERVLDAHEFGPVERPAETTGRVDPGGLRRWGLHPGCAAGTAEFAPARAPRPVRQAATLWTVLGVLAFVGPAFAYVRGGRSVAPLPSNLLLMYSLAGLVMIVLAVWLRLGSRPARRALTVLGLLMSIGGWPLLFAVPAMIKQYKAQVAYWFDGGRPNPGPSQPPP